MISYWIKIRFMVWRLIIFMNVNAFYGIFSKYDLKSWLKQEIFRPGIGRLAALRRGGSAGLPPFSKIEPDLAIIINAAKFSKLIRSHSRFAPVQPVYGRFLCAKKMAGTKKLTVPSDVFSVSFFFMYILINALIGFERVNEFWIDVYMIDPINNSYSYVYLFIVESQLDTVLIIFV